MFSRNSYHNLLIILVTCFFLSACNSNDDSLPLDTIELNGIVINSDNFETVFRTGLVNSGKITNALSYALTSLASSDLSLFTELPQNDSNTTSYECNTYDLGFARDSGQAGTLKISNSEPDTQEWLLDDCYINSTNQSYSGKFSVRTTVNSGNISEINNSDRSDYNWSVTRTFSLVDFYIPEANWSGLSYSHSGDFEITSSNNTTNFSTRTIISSPNLSVDEETNSGVIINYSYTDLSRDSLLQYLSADRSQLDITSIDYEFLANISNIGDIQMTMDSALVLKDRVLLRSGTGSISTGKSTAKFVSIGVDGDSFGSNDIEISLDPENDGTFEDPILTSWLNLGGGGSLSLELLIFIFCLGSIVALRRRKM